MDSESSGSGEVKAKDGDGMEGVVGVGAGDDVSKTAKKERGVSSTKHQRLGDAIFGVSTGSTDAGGGIVESKNPFSMNLNGQSGMSSGHRNPFSMKAATTSTSASKPQPKPSSKPDISTVNTSKSSEQDATGLPERFRSAVRIADDNSAATSTNTTTTTIAAPITTATRKDSEPLSYPTQGNTAQTQPQPHEPWPPRSAFPTPYPRFPLEADYETLDKTSDSPTNFKTHSEDAMQIDDDTADANANANANANADTNEKQIFESTLDKTFQRFADRLAQNPEQVLRYEFGGKPLLYASSDGSSGDDDKVARAFRKGSTRWESRTEVAVNDGSGNKKSGTGGFSIDSVVSSPATNTNTNTNTGTAGVGAGKGTSLPPCPNCNAPRVFEVQLTPHAIETLEGDGEGAGTGTGNGLDGMSWGTIIVAVCLADCRPVGVDIGQVGYLKEWVGVQWEEEVEEVKK